MLWRHTDPRSSGLTDLSSILTLPPNCVDLHHFAGGLSRPWPFCVRSNSEWSQGHKGRYSSVKAMSRDFISKLEGICFRHHFVVVGFCFLISVKSSSVFMTQNPCSVWLDRGEVRVWGYKTQQTLRNRRIFLVQGRVFILGMWVLDIREYTYKSGTKIHKSQFVWWIDRYKHTNSHPVLNKGQFTLGDWCQSLKLTQNHPMSEWSYTWVWTAYSTTREAGPCYVQPEQYTST